MPKETLIELERLLPIQLGANAQTIEEMGRAMLRGVELPPVPVVPIDEEDITGFILPDGHHRVHAHHDLGLTTIRAVVCESDDDVANCRDGALAGLRTLAAVRDLYVELWRPNLRFAGIYTLDDFWGIPRALSVSSAQQLARSFAALDAADRRRN